MLRRSARRRPGKFLCRGPQDGLLFILVEGASASPDKKARRNTAIPPEQKLGMRSWASQGSPCIFARHSGDFVANSAGASLHLASVPCLHPDRGCAAPRRESGRSGAPWRVVPAPPPSPGRIESDACAAAWAYDGVILWRTDAAAFEHRAGGRPAGCCALPTGLVSRVRYRPASRRSLGPALGPGDRRFCLR